MTLDVFSLNHDGLLDWDRKSRGSVVWGVKATGDSKAEIGFELNTTDRAGPWLRVFYTSTDRRTGESTRSDYKIPLQVTLPYFGGRRWWFACPSMVDGRYCGRRVGKLYIPPGGHQFGCRHCHDLTYRSSQESDKRVSALKRALLAGDLDPQDAFDAGRPGALLALKTLLDLAGL